MRSGLLKLAVVLSGLLPVLGCDGDKFSFKGSSNNKPNSPASSDGTPGDDGTVGGDVKVEDVADHDGDGVIDANDHDSGGVGGNSDYQAAESPQVAMLVNDFSCSMCHLRVNGDILSTRAITSDNWSKGIAWHITSSQEVINGNWYATKGWTNASVFDAPAPQMVIHKDTEAPALSYSVDGKLAVKISFEPGYEVKANYGLGPMMTRDLNGDGEADFPTLNWDTLGESMKGSVSHGNTTIDKIQNGNLALIGTQAAPVILNGEVLVKGDLIIAGIYTGVGTIYATGRIYIPANLRSKQSVFPFPSDRPGAIKKARDVMSDAGNLHALGLASQRSVLIGSLEGYYTSKGADGLTGAEHFAANLEKYEPDYKAVYSWFDNYKSLYKPATDCMTGLPLSQSYGGFDIVEAYLYAQNAVIGRAYHGAYAINGGIIADYLHIIALAGWYKDGAAHDCRNSQLVNPANGNLSMNNRYLNYDYRMRVGLKVLEQFGKFFNAVPVE